MIDVVFLLLVFFVWTASFQVVEQVLPSSVTDLTGGEAAPPDAPPPPEADFPDLVVRVLWIGEAPAWQLNDKLLADLASLRSQLRQVYEINAAAPVIIHPDPDTPLGHVIDVYDTSRLVGFSKVQFAVSAGETYQ